VIADVATGRDLLGEHRDEPPDYVSPLFAVAALVYELRGDTAAADELLAVLTGMFDSRPPEDRDGLPLSRWAEYTARVTARRGDTDRALRLIEATTWRRRQRQGSLYEATFDVLSIAGDHGDGRARAAEARAASPGLEAVGYAADAFEGEAVLVAGDPRLAIDLLSEARAGFARLGAVWDDARTAVVLARALAAAGDTVQADRITSSAESTLADLGDLDTPARNGARRWS
jgi:hypothetical protein